MVAGLSQAVAGLRSQFQLTARDFYGNLRTNGGDVFKWELVSGDTVVTGSSTASTNGVYTVRAAPCACRSLLPDTAWLPQPACHRVPSTACLPVSRLPRLNVCYPSTTRYGSNSPCFPPVLQVSYTAQLVGRYTLQVTLPLPLPPSPFPRVSGCVAMSSPRPPHPAGHPGHGADLPWRHHAAGGRVPRPARRRRQRAGGHGAVWRSGWHHRHLHYPGKG